MKVCDDTFYWFISFLKYKPLSDEDREIHEAFGIESIEYEVFNLWPCRLCGAMIAGSLRHVHEEFHSSLKSN